MLNLIIRECLAFVSSYLVKLWQFRLITQFRIIEGRRNETQNQLYSPSLFSHNLSNFSILYIHFDQYLAPVDLKNSILFYTETLSWWQIWNLETLLTKKNHALKFDPNLGRNLGQITRHVFATKVRSCKIILCAPRNVL